MTIKKYLAAALAVTFLTAGQLAQAAGLPDFTELAAKSGPAVVNIGTERKASGGGPEDFFGEMFRNMPPGFEKFFDQFGGGKGRGRQAAADETKIPGLGLSCFRGRLYCNQQSCGGRRGCHSCHAG